MRAPSPDPATGSRATPIYQTTAYQFRDTETRLEPVRIGRDRQHLHPHHESDPSRRRSAHRGARGCAGTPQSACRGHWCCELGQAAETFAILDLAEAGSHIVASAALYGGTYNLLHYTLPKFGASRPRSSTTPTTSTPGAKAVRPNTKAFYGETIPNPKNDIFDIEGVAGVAHDEGVPLIIDNTVASPYLIRPLEWGADIVVHSLTKFLGGHGNSIGGAIVDGGTFDFGSSGRFPGFTEPTRATTAWPTGRRSGPVRSRSRPGCNCCAISVRRSHRSTPSSSSRGSRR